MQPDEEVGRGAVPERTGADNRARLIGVGVGPGGLPALERMIARAAAAGPAAWLLALPLDAEATGELAERVSRCASLPVRRVEEPRRVEPGAVFLAASGHALALRDGLLRAEALAPAARRAPADDLFRALAAAAGDRAVGIVLAGSGCDGSLGARALKAAGGVVVAQAPWEAERESMPRSLVGTGLVDLVLPAAEIPAALRAHAAAGAAPSAGAGEDIHARARAVLDDVLAIAHPGEPTRLWVVGPGARAHAAALDATLRARGVEAELRCLADDAELLAALRTVEWASRLDLLVRRVEPPLGGVRDAAPDSALAAACRGALRPGALIWLDPGAALAWSAEGFELADLRRGLLRRPADHVRVKLARREAELRAAREREAWLSELLDKASVVAYAKDWAGRYLVVNRSYLELFALRAEQVLGRTDHELFPAPMADAFRANDERVLRSGVPISFDETARGQDGALRTYISVKFPMRDARGEVYGVGGVSTDITTRRHAEEALERSEARLRASEQRYRLLVQASTSVVWASDAQGCLVEPQPSWEAYTGQSSDAYAGRGWLDAFHPEDRAQMEARVEQVLRERRPGELQGRLWCARTRTHRRVVVHAAPLIDERGEVREWIGALSDLEDRLQMEEARRRAEEQDRHAERLREEDSRKSEFLAQLGHELRNPLAVMCHALSVLRHLGAEPSRHSALLGMLDRQTEHMTRLLDDLLDVSRIARGKVLLRKAELDLAELVRRVIADQRALLGRGGLTLSAVVPDAAVAVYGDATRLAQMLGNLLDNARKYTDRGGHVEVRLTPRPSDGVVELRVSDDGIGIRPELLEQIFSPSVQLEEARERSEGGLGVGLALVKGLAELHGGRVWAHSAGPGRGATFGIELPLHAAQDEVAARSPDEAARPHEGGTT